MRVGVEGGRGGGGLTMRLDRTVTRVATENGKVFTVTP